MNRKWIVPAVGVVVLVLVWLAVSDQRHPQEIQVEESLALESLLHGSEDHGFAQALEVRRIEFPRDHGPHPDFQTEWWYFTGNLTSANGRHFGYQFTIFRRSTTSNQVELDSDWASNQIYLAHIGISDIDGNKYLVDEVYSREALGLAGAKLEPFVVWVENWSARGAQGHCQGCLDLQVKAQSELFSMNLQLVGEKPAVLQGEKGLSRKGRSPGNASYYYSLTRMATKGTITVRGESVAVNGLSWMDHEWFSSVLEDETDGWDWFSIQLDDGRDLMLFQVRSGAGYFKYGVVIDLQGKSKKLDVEQIRLTEAGFWSSEQSRAKYPVDWNIQVRELDMELTIKAAMNAQERIGSFRYWEGAITVKGVAAGKAISGKGYLEMTGY